MSASRVLAPSAARPTASSACAASAPAACSHSGNRPDALSAIITTKPYRKSGTPGLRSDVAPGARSPAAISITTGASSITRIIFSTSALAAASGPAAAAPATTWPSSCTERPTQRPNDESSRPLSGRSSGSRYMPSVPNTTTASTAADTWRARAPITLSAAATAAAPQIALPQPISTAAWVSSPSRRPSARASASVLSTMTSAIASPLQPTLPSSSMPMRRPYSAMPARISVPRASRNPSAPRVGSAGHRLPTTMPSATASGSQPKPCADTPGTADSAAAAAATATDATRPVGRLEAVRAVVEFMDASRAAGK